MKKYKSTATEKSHARVTKAQETDKQSTVRFYCLRIINLIKKATFYLWIFDRFFILVIGRLFHAVALGPSETEITSPILIVYISWWPVEKVILLR